jgi:hypothetical protein
MRARARATAPAHLIFCAGNNNPDCFIKQANIFILIKKIQAISYAFLQFSSFTQHQRKRLLLSFNSFN